MDNQNSNIRKNKFIMSDFFWIALIVTVAGMSLSKAVPILGLFGGVGLLAFLFAVSAEVYTTVKELDEIGVPRNEQQSWWVIIGWWCIFIGDPFTNGVNFFFIAGILLLLVELKNIIRFGGYLWARRGFMSFIFGFIVPLAIILIIMDTFRMFSSSGKRK